jgi:hypothetical protein
MSFECEYCSKIYSSKGNLTKHQHTAKFCLKLQNKELDIEFKCDDCNYISGLKYDLSTHRKTCKNKKKKLIKESKDKDLQLALNKQQIKIQQGIIAELKKEAFKPKTTNNNITYNVQMEYCKQHLAPYEEFMKHAKKFIWTHFKTSHLLKGVDGIVILLNKILPLDNPRYLLSFENSKQSFYRNNKNAIELDDKADKLLTDVHPMIMEIVNEKYREEINSTPLNDTKTMQELSDVRQSIVNIKDRGSKERKKCVSAISDALCVSNTSMKNNHLIEVE